MCTASTDGCLVIHDDRLERTTSGSGDIQSLGIGQLRALDAGGGQPIPFVEEVFDALPAEVGINVEMKGPATAEPGIRDAWGFRAPAT